jgi:hypothetical protein
MKMWAIFPDNELNLDWALSEHKENTVPVGAENVIGTNIGFIISNITGECSNSTLHCLLSSFLFCCLKCRLLIVANVLGFR